MRKIFFLTAVLFGVLTLCSAQQAPEWDKWNWLIGEWIGEGSGQPGQGSGTFSFVFDLDKKVIIRRSHSEYPASDNKPGIIHSDLMVIYTDSNGDKAVYFDNEGHTIFYSASFSDKTITLTSEKSENTPVFRLIYTLIDNDDINTQFQMSQDGLKFTSYVEGKSKRIKPGH